MHEKVYDKMLEELLKAYSQVEAGNPLEEKTLLGPLHSPYSKTSFEQGIHEIKAQVRSSTLTAMLITSPIVSTICTCLGMEWGLEILCSNQSTSFLKSSISASVPF